MSYEESDIFFEQRGEVSGSQVGEILATYVIPFYVTGPMQIYEPWAGL